MLAFFAGVPVNIVKAVTAPSSILCPNFSCAGFTIAWFLLSLFGFVVQIQMSKNVDGKDNLSSTTNAYDDFSQLARVHRVLCTVAKFYFRNERPWL